MPLRVTGYLSNSVQTRNMLNVDQFTLLPIYLLHSSNLDETFSRSTGHCQRWKHKIVLKMQKVERLKGIGAIQGVSFTVKVSLAKKLFD